MYATRQIAGYRGFTLIEVLVTVAIVAIVLTMIGWRGFRDKPRQNLAKTYYAVENALRKAQAEAVRRDRIVGLCFKAESPTTHSAEGYLPTLNSSGTPTDEDCGASEPKLFHKTTFANNVKICEAACDSKVTVNKSVFFNRHGLPMKLNGTEIQYEICLVNSDMPAGMRAREIEISRAGFINIISLGSAGKYSTVQANTTPCR